MSYELQGKLKVKNDTVVVSEKFSKREFVIETAGEYPQQIIFQLAQTRCKVLDNHNIGDDVKVGFNLRGREWVSKEGVVKYFNTLDAWKIEKVGNEPAPAKLGDKEPIISEDLPF